MELHFKTHLQETHVTGAFKTFPRVDTGKFDVCQACELKQAVLSLKRKSEHAAFNKS
ncbi:MAG: hypothetical protein V4635_13330 [Bacteroidota bacterium]